MFTALIDYAKLVKKDKKLALEILNEHDQILSTIIKEYYGNIILSNGDRKPFISNDDFFDGIFFYDFLDRW